ncbi:hypothetical protein WN48_06474 [Eufriesea mexicana]|uniref:Uncharacterized protein n=1 Tax=Eufriesea mexicana TaxID=516756 RepID=A0A310STF8_9HYME|nr:hypothetical protein WN48_06474 [Eufriesea mexicana]
MYEDLLNFVLRSSSKEISMGSMTTLLYRLIVNYNKLEERYDLMHVALSRDIHVGVAGGPVLVRSGLGGIEYSVAMLVTWCWLYGEYFDGVANNKRGRNVGCVCTWCSVYCECFVWEGLFVLSSYSFKERRQTFSNPFGHLAQRKLPWRKRGAEGLANEVDNSIMVHREGVPEAVVKTSMPAYLGWGLKYLVVKYPGCSCRDACFMRNPWVSVCGSSSERLKDTEAGWGGALPVTG